MQNMIEVDLPTILTITGAVMTPLLTVIGVLWFAWQKALDKNDTDNEAWQNKWDLMKDKMQEKIDSANQKANDAISTVTTALNAMSITLSSSKDDKAKMNEEWRLFKDDILRAVREVVEKLK